MVSDLTFVVGRDVNTGEEVRVGLTPNLFIVGDDANDRVAMIRSITNQLTHDSGPEELKFVVVDTKNTAPSSFCDLPHLIWPVIEGAEGFLETLKRLEREVDARYELIRQTRGCNSAQAYNQKYPNKMPPIIVVIDDLADIMRPMCDAATELSWFFLKYQRASDVHFIIGATAWEGFVKWDAMETCPIALRQKAVFLPMSRKENCRVFYDFDNDSEFTGFDERQGYYWDNCGAGKLRKFDFLRIGA